MMNIRYNASEIFKEKIISSITFFGQILSCLTVIFTIILLVIIIKKTPKTMKRFKFYIIQYVCFALIFEFVLLICPFTLLHPYSFVYINGILPEIIHPKVLPPILSIGIFGAFSMLDCSIAIIFERYYALTSTTNSTTKQPFYLYIFLLSMNIIMFVLINLSYLTGLNTVIISSDEVASYVDNYVNGLETKIIIENLLIFKSSANTTLPLEVLAMIGYGLVRVILALFGLILNVKQSQNIHLQTQLSHQVQKANDLLNRIIYIQLFGYLFLLGLPIFITAYAYYFIEEPSNIPNYSNRVLTSYGLYDTIFTSILIKPYRETILYPFMVFKSKIILKKVHISIY